MSERRLYLDRSEGETRGVVTLDDRPERLLILRDDEPAALRLGARLRARVRRVEPALGSAFLDLGGGDEALLDFRPDARPVEGEALEVEVRAEPRRGKLAVVRALGQAHGAPGLIAPAPDVRTQLLTYARHAVVVEGGEARTVADEAEAEALATVHPLPGGGSIAIEPTRALTAIDVDVGERRGQEVKRVTRQANLAALGVAARLLRLKSLGGLVVFDLVGRGHDGAALTAAARAAFAPDNPGVVIGPISKFGAIELTIARRGRPLADLLLDASGAPSLRTLAQRLVRRIEDEAATQPGARIGVECAPELAAVVRPLVERLTQRFGARLTLADDAARSRSDFRVTAQ